MRPLPSPCISRMSGYSDLPVLGSGVASFKTSSCHCNCQSASAEWPYLFSKISSLKFRMRLPSCHWLFCFTLLCSSLHCFCALAQVLESFIVVFFCLFFGFNACWQGQEPCAVPVADGGVCASGVQAHTGTDKAYQRMD